MASVKRRGKSLGGGMGLNPSPGSGGKLSNSGASSTSAMLSRLEPAATVTQDRIRLGDGKEVLVFVAPALAGEGPFTFDGRPYQRVGSTTTILPRETYESLILQNVHPRHRWETMEACKTGIEDLDANEILRTVRLGIEAGRLPEATGTNIPEILDRLELRVDGQKYRLTENGRALLVQKEPESSEEVE